MQGKTCMGASQAPSRVVAWQRGKWMKNVVLEQLSLLKNGYAYFMILINSLKYCFENLRFKLKGCFKYSLQEKVER